MDPGLDGRSLTVIITGHANKTFDFTITGGVTAAVFVKSGTQLVYRYNPPVSSDTGLIVAGGQALSHLSFCLAGKATPTIATQVSSASITIGQSVTDTATVSGGNNPTGTVSFRAYSDANCTVQVFESLLRPLSGTPPSATSGSFTPSAPGTYKWIATYNGDPNNNSVSGVCGATGETVVVNQNVPEFATAPWVIPQDTAKIGDLVAGDITDPFGDFKFELFANATCTGLPVFSQTVDVTGNGTLSTTNSGAPANTPTSFRITADGTWYWLVTYSGDANNAGAVSACGDEQVTVNLTP